MLRSLVVRAAALFVLSLLLAAPWSAAEPREIRGHASPPALGQLWSQLTALWADIGCVIDPSGACRDTVAGQSNIGCVIDPGGRCRDAVTSQSDIGCGIDPHGGCGH
jgi:hypothetical protein